MRKSTLLAAVVTVGAVMAGTTPSFAASAANSQNGTDSSNAYATSSAPTSTSAVPATGMQMGTQPGAMQTQEGATMNGGAMAPNGTTGTSGMTTAPKQ